MQCVLCKQGFEGRRFNSSSIAGGSEYITNLVITLILAMVVAIILGMGLPTVAAYMLAATVVAAAFVEAGLPALSSHLFILYFAILSGVTPPAALAAYTGSAIPAHTGSVRR